MFSPGQLVQRHKPGVTYGLLSFLCLVMILFSNRNVVIRPREVGHSLFALVQGAAHGVSGWFSDTWNSIGELREMREELERAREKLFEYERITREVTDLRRENEELKRQLDFSAQLPSRRIAAEVIARDPGNRFSTVVVNKGSIQGVKKNMTVVAFQGGLQGLVGKVVLAGLASATVKPITDATSYVAARLQDSRYEGLVNGMEGGENRLLMSYISKQVASQIQYGEVVVTSGMGGLYPRGIPIGRVREMRSRVYEASLEIAIEPIIDFSRLEYVYILEAGQ